MGKLSAQEVAAREHFTEWFLYFRQAFYVAEGLPDIRFAKDLGVSRSYVSAVAAREKTVGFDVALRMREKFRRTLDVLAFKRPEDANAEAPPGTPKEASSTHAHPKRRRHGGAS